MKESKNGHRWTAIGTRATCARCGVRIGVRIDIVPVGGFPRITPALYDVDAGTDGVPSCRRRK